MFPIVQDMVQGASEQAHRMFNFSLEVSANVKRVTSRIPNPGMRLIKIPLLFSALSINYYNYYYYHHFHNHNHNHNHLRRHNQHHQQLKDYFSLH